MVSNVMDEVFYVSWMYNAASGLVYVKLTAEESI